MHMLISVLAVLFGGAQVQASVLVCNLDSRRVTFDGMYAGPSQEPHVNPNPEYDVSIESETMGFIDVPGKIVTVHAQSASEAEQYVQSFFHWCSLTNFKSIPNRF